MSYNYDDSTIGEGIIAWLCFNLGIIPVFIYIFYLHTNKGRTWGFWGYLGKTAGITFIVLLLIAGFDATTIKGVSLEINAKYPCFNSPAGQAFALM